MTITRAWQTALDFLDLDLDALDIGEALEQMYQIKRAMKALVVTNEQRERVRAKYRGEGCPTNKLSPSFRAGPVNRGNFIDEFASNSFMWRAKPASTARSHRVAWDPEAAQTNATRPAPPAPTAPRLLTFGIVSASPYEPARVNVQALAIAHGRGAR